MSRNIIIICYLILFIFMVTEANDGLKEANVSSVSEGLKPHHFQIFSIEWGHVQAAYTVTIWILVASVAKICKHLLFFKVL